MGKLYQQLARLIAEGRYVVGQHASERLEERGIMRIAGKRVARTRFIHGGRFVVAVDIEMVIPPDDTSEPCYGAETVELLKQVADRAQHGDKAWLLEHGRVYELVSAE